MKKENKKLESYLKKEWEQDVSLHNFYDDLDDYILYMCESIEQYKEIKLKVKNWKGNLESFVKELEYGYINYEYNEYVDFYYGNLTLTIYVKNNKLILSDWVELWNDRYCALINAPFDITEYLK